MPTLSTLVPFVVVVTALVIVQVLCLNVWQKPFVQPDQTTPAQPVTRPIGWFSNTRSNSWPQINNPVHNNNNNNYGNSYASRAGGSSSNVAFTTGPRRGESSGNIGQNLNSNSQQQQPSEQALQVDDNELRELSEALLSKDVNNAAQYLTVRYQGRTTSRSENDEAPLPLLSIPEEVYRISSIEKMMLLHDNYVLETNQNEYYTAQEKTEENNFLDTILSTPVMQHTRNFLIQKGRIGRDPKEFKDLLREIWFSMYSRGGGRVGSSGFEHVFLAEIKNNQISGLHNWLYFGEGEKANQLDYLGYMRKLDLGNKGAILKFHMKFHGIDKPVSAMFVGTSPELEMALYSTCFLLRADRICPLKLNGNKFIIRTYTYRYRGKNMIGSAFPEI